MGLNDYVEFLKSSFAKKEIAKLDNICFGDFALIARGARFERQITYFTTISEREITEKKNLDLKIRIQIIEKWGFKISILQSRCKFRV